MDILERIQTAKFVYASQIALGDLILGNGPRDDIRVSSIEDGGVDTHGSRLVKINGRNYATACGMFVR